MATPPKQPSPEIDTLLEELLVFCYKPGIIRSIDTVLEDLSIDTVLEDLLVGLVYDFCLAINCPGYVHLTGIAPVSDKRLDVIINRVYHYATTSRVYAKPTHHANQDPINEFLFQRKLRLLHEIVTSPDHE